MRSFLAPNASPMTLDGTITYVVGRRRAAIIDPGSEDERHLSTLADAVSGAEHVVVLVTHYHPDHSTGALTLADRIGAALLGGRSGRAAPETPRGPARPGKAAAAAGGGLLAEGTRVKTDEGDLVIVRTPGHSPDHIALHWPDADAVFCGDLMMGGLDTAVVAAPEGNLAEYLASLERLRQLNVSTIYPSHGPPFTEPEEAIARYVRHRLERLAQVRAAMDAGARDTAAVTDAVYGPDLDPGLRPFAEAAVDAYIQHLGRA
jgi:glyoxylase-like metal-dependent hydrolase (beta-lactamase superfamily II)